MKEQDPEHIAHLLSRHDGTTRLTGLTRLGASTPPADPAELNSLEQRTFVPEADFLNDVSSRSVVSQDRYEDLLRTGGTNRIANHRLQATGPVSAASSLGEGIEIKQIRAVWRQRQLLPDFVNETTVSSVSILTQHHLD